MDEVTQRILIGVARADIIVSGFIRALPTIVGWAVALLAVVYFWNRRTR